VALPVLCLMMARCELSVGRLWLAFKLNKYIFAVNVKLPAIQRVPILHITCPEVQADLMQSSLYPLLTLTLAPRRPFCPTIVQAVITPTWWFVALPLRALASVHSAGVHAVCFSCCYRSRAEKTAAALTCASEGHLWHRNCDNCVRVLATKTQRIQSATWL
jgi:hypothetical protein